MTPDDFKPPRTVVAALASLLTAIAAWAIACTGSGHGQASIPTPVGPAVVDLWWCEEGQCVVADDPANTPQGAKVLASGVELDPLFLLPKSPDPPN